MIKFTRTIIESHHPDAEITFMLLVSIIISTSSLKISICYLATKNRQDVNTTRTYSYGSRGRFPSGGRAGMEADRRIGIILIESSSC